MSLNFKKYPSKNSNTTLTFLVVHGWGASLSHIEPLSSLLSNLGDVYAVDLPGHGSSSLPEEVWGMNNFADCIYDFLNDMGLSKVVYVGHSFGGKTGIKFTSKYPSFIDKLVLLGASGLRPKPTLKKKIRNSALAFLRNFLRFKNTSLGNYLYQNWFIPKFASRDYKNAGPLLKTFVKTVNEELQAELKSINCPCLLIWGSEDDESPLSVGERMNELIPNSRLITLPGQGHYPYLGGSLGLLNRYIKDFVEGV